MSFSNKHLECSRNKDNYSITPSPHSAAALIKAAKHTLTQLETNKLFQKPRLPLKKELKPLFLHKQPSNVLPELLQIAPNYRAKSAITGNTALNDDSHDLFPDNIDKQEITKRYTFDTSQSKDLVHGMQVFSPCEGDLTLKAKKVYAIRRRKLWSGDLHKVSSNSTPSRGTTRGSETGLSLTGDTKEDEISEKMITDPIESENEEEKTESSVQVSHFQISVSGDQDLEQFEKNKESSLQKNPNLDEKSTVRKSTFHPANNQNDHSFDVKMGDLIGEGAFGQVYQALHLETGQFVAVKHILIGELSDNLMSGVETLCQEIAVYQKLEHPNIVKYLGAKQNHQDIYIYMELMTGGSISSMLKQYGSFEESVIRKFTKQLVLGLDYLHSNGIIHRDIKGGNIMSNRDGDVKLADFGAAKSIEDYSLLASNMNIESNNSTELCNSIKGSLYWMAPELLRQEKYGRKIDIWSLGCTIIEMATATHPWYYFLFDYPHLNIYR